MPPLANVAIATARTHLNDEQGSLWPTQKIMPKLRAAYNEMLNELVRNSVPIVNAVSTIMTVVANTIDDNNLDLSNPVNLSAGTYPTDMIEPIWMKERAVGQANKDFVDMTKVDFIPNISLSNVQLIWWSWIGQKIIVRGATSPVQIQLRYRKLLSPPNTVTDDLIVTLSDTYLGAETAYLCLVSLPDYDKGVAKALKDLSERNLDNIIAEAVKGLSNLPAKRRPYHRGHGRSRAIRDF